MRVSEDDMVHALRTNSNQAWVEIIAVYRPRVYAAALRFTKNHHEAEDITQETFCRAFLAGPRFRAESSLGTWLIAIANNLARSRYWYLRRRKSDETLSIEGPAPGVKTASLGDTLASDVPTGSEKAERDDLFEHLEQGIARLPDLDRRILVLRDRQHASYGEIADSLVIPMGTVKSRIARARRHLIEIVRREMIGWRR